MISKLSQWELDKQAALQKEIRSKRDEVLGLLKKEMELMTRSGDLEGALAIRQEISRLEQNLLGTTEKKPSPAPAPEAKPRDDQPGYGAFDIKNLQGTTWIGIDGDLEGGKIEFYPNGKMRVFPNPGSSNNWPGWIYALEDSDLMITPGGSKKSEVRLSRRNTRMTIPSRGTFELKAKPKKPE